MSEIAPDNERGPYFDHCPDGDEIMAWFIAKQLAREWVGCGGDADYILWHDSDTVSGRHLDLLAKVDHDAAWYFLLDVGTYADGGQATADLLFVAWNLDGRRVNAWRNAPSPHQANHWGFAGMVWFAEQIESFEGRTTAEPLAEIRALHAKEENGGCKECGLGWPCPTFHFASGWGEMFGCWEAGWCSHVDDRVDPAEAGFDPAHFGSREQDR